MSSNDGRARWERAVADAVAAGVPGAAQLARRLDPGTKVTAEQYGDLCDVVYRASHGMPLVGDPCDPFMHTSDVARAAAMRIIEILGLEHEDPREISR